MRDNFLIIKVLQGRAQCPWKIQLLIHDIKQLLTNFNCYTLCHVYREANRTTHHVTASGQCITTSEDIDPLLDSKVLYFINLDKLGYVLKKRLY